MNNLSDIKRRIESVKQTRQITGAMETVSIAKMRKSSELCERNRAYFDILCGVMKDIVSRGDESVGDYISAPKSGDPLVIVIASDKGLCGAFNHDVFRLADGVIKDDSTIVAIGRTTIEKYRNGNTVDRFADCSDNFDYAKAREIADYILARYGVDFSSVTIVYSHMKNAAVWAPRVLKVLPFEPNDADGQSEKHTVVGPIEFEPSPIAVLERLLPIYVGGTVYGALVNSAAAEHCARRASMSAATENADAVIAELSIEYNRARQSAVTSQITEIVGSTQALSNQGDRK